MDGRGWDADLPDADAAPLFGADRRGRPAHGGGLTARLERWAGDARVDEAARRRSRERWLLQSAEEGGTLAGVLADLAERGVAVALRTSAGRRHGGRVRAIGADFVALDTVASGEVVVALAAISSVRTRPGHAPAGDRPVHSDLRLAEVLAGLAAERERALVVGIDGDAAAGTVRAVGQDVVVVRVDGDGLSVATAYVPLAAVGEVVIG